MLVIRIAGESKELKNGRQRRGNGRQRRGLEDSKERVIQSLDETSNVQNIERLLSLTLTLHGKVIGCNNNDYAILL